MEKTDIERMEEHVKELSDLYWETWDKILYHDIKILLEDLE